MLFFLLSGAARCLGIRIGERANAASGDCWWKRSRFVRAPRRSVHTQTPQFPLSEFININCKLQFVSEKNTWQKPVLNWQTRQDIFFISSICWWHSVHIYLWPDFLHHSSHQSFVSDLRNKLHTWLIIRVIKTCYTFLWLNHQIHSYEQMEWDGGIPQGVCFLSFVSVLSYF